MKKIILFLLLSVSLNANASNEEGKWYKFTENYVNGCVENVNDAKQRNTNRENNGISVSAIMEEISRDCLKSTQAYNETDGQVTQHSMSTSRKSCASTTDGKFLLPVGTHNQKIKIISVNKLYTKEYTCNNGTWGASASQSLIPDKVYCASTCLSWNGGLLSECSVDSVVGEVDSCGSVFPQSLAGSVITLKSLSDFKEGHATVQCNSEGKWILKDYSCESDTCIANEVVTWNDKEIEEYYAENKEKSDSKGTELGSQSVEQNSELESKIQYLKDKLSRNTANGYNVEGIIKELQRLLSSNSYNDNIYHNSTSQDQEKIDSNSFSNPFEGDSQLGGLYECQAKVITNNGKYGYVTYLTEDKRIFRTLEEGLKNHNIVKGSANLVCDNGKWKFNTSTMECRRRVSGVSCSNLVNLGKKEGKKVNGYQCKNN